MRATLILSYQMDETDCQFSKAFDDSNRLCAFLGGIILNGYRYSHGTAGAMRLAIHASKAGFEEYVEYDDTADLDVRLSFYHSDGGDRFMELTVGPDRTEVFGFKDTKYLRADTDWGKLEDYAVGEILKECQKIV